jgi:hypothetical protein
VDIREIVLRHLYENDNGQLIDLVKILEPFDNDATRKQVNELLNNLDKVDKHIFIDNEYRRMIGKDAGKHKPISQCKIKARLTNSGRLFVEKQYLKKDDKPTVKVEMKGDKANLHIGDNFGDYNQSNQESTKSHINEISKPVKTPLKNTIIKWILSIVAGVIASLIVWRLTGRV